MNKSEKVVQISPNTKSSVRAYIQSIAVAQRKQPCPVKKRFLKSRMTGQTGQVTEYLIPINKIIKDRKSQPRKHGKGNKTISELFPQFKQDGQSEGICVAIYPKSGGSPSFHDGFVVVLRWGNHRLATVEMLEACGDSILGAEVGYIWAQLYNENYQESDLNTVQCIENNISKAKHLANREENIGYLEAQFGSCPVFLNYSEEKKVKVAVEWIKETIGSNEKKPKALVYSWFATNDDMKTDTKTKIECQTHFNDFVAHVEGLPNLRFAQAGNAYNDVESGGKKYSLYTINMGKFEDGAQRQRMSNKKFGLDGAKTDVIIQVVALSLPQLKTEASRVKARDRYMEEVAHWNEQYVGGRLIDHVFFVPQTELESAMDLPNWLSQQHAHYDLTLI